MNGEEKQAVVTELENILGGLFGEQDRLLCAQWVEGKDASG